MTRKDCIYIYNNNKGTLINVNLSIPRDISNESYMYDVFYEENKKEKMKNRIILSAPTTTNVDQGINKKVNISLITQQNLIHNIKFINRNNDLSKPRIVFTNYYTTNNIINNKTYLFDTILNTVLEDSGKNLCIFNNFYKNYLNTDYYKFRLSDFIDISYVKNNLLLSDVSLNNLNYLVKNITVENDFSNNPSINYNENNFTSLYRYNLNNIDSSNNITQIDKIVNNIDTSFDYVDDNILLYNKLHNISSLNLSYRYKNGNNLDDIVDYTDLSINFTVQKGYDNYTKLAGKILLNNKFTYINTRVIDISSNFYLNNGYYKNMIDNNKMIYLSFGNNITGFTFHDIYSKIKIIFDISSTITNIINEKTYIGTKKIYISDKINYIEINNEEKNKYYLIDNSYNYDYINILYNNIQEKNAKFVNLNLKDFYHKKESYNNNLYLPRFNTLELINTDISNNYFDNSYSFDKIKYYIEDIDITPGHKLKINNNNSNALLSNIVDISQLNYDFRFNYSSNFDVNMLLSYKYDLNTIESLDDMLDYSNNLLLNFHKITLTSNFQTTTGSDFTNVDCIFIYHDPEKTDNPEFKYPNNNIEIVKDITIDTLSKAIELLPGARTATSNSVFIPSKNGSNLSRKHIQGLIGLNNIPRLLSIEPYDESFIDGRGFINQFQITDTCKTYRDKVVEKLNSQKHDSIKRTQNNMNIPKKTNFANLVKSSTRNRGISQNTNQSCNEDPGKITNYYTPFTFFKTGKGKYLDA